MGKDECNNCCKTSDRGKSVIFSRSYVAVLVCAVLAGIIIFVTGHNRKSFRLAQGEVWTTGYHITYEADEDLADSVKAVFNRVDESASAFNQNSLVSQINQNKTDKTDVLFRLMYNTSLNINKATGGAYDVTVMPLVNAWGFGYKQGKLPNKPMIDSLLQFVGVAKTQLQGRRIVKHDARTQFDFSSIAKGLGCDEVAHMLERNGVANYLVEVGGEVVAKGKNQRGTAWQVSVDMPSEDEQGNERASALVLRLEQGAVATSGNYRRFKNVGGKKVSHIINPVTGYSSESSLLSVTIVASNCMEADAWATACMAMGIDKTKAMFEHHKNLGVMTICAKPNGDLVVWSNAVFASHVVQ